MKVSDRKLRWRLLLGLVLAVGLSGPAAALEVWASSPWLTQMMRFMVGVQGKVHPVRWWTEDGRVVRVSSPRGPVMALDPKEAAEAGVSRSPSLRVLFDRPLPLGELKGESAYFDPAALPFIGQRILQVLATQDPANYRYYQRRLAELQARIDSTMDVGRQLLKGVGVLDLTGCAGPWIRSAAATSARPPGDLWRAWEGGGRMDLLKGALDAAGRKGWVVVMDPWTPSPVASVVSASGVRVVRLSPPKGDDMFLYYYDLYLQVWNFARR